MDQPSTSDTQRFPALSGLVEFKHASGSQRPAEGEMNRRRHVRHTLARPCTLHSTGAADPIPATTANVSAGGALLCVPRCRDFAAGESVSLVIGFIDETDLAGAPYRRARVVRVTPMDCHQQALALEFEKRQSAAQAA